MTTTTAIAPSLDALGWIAGDWIGTLGDQTVEEFWTAPRHGCVENKVRLSSPENVALIELMMVRDATTDSGEPTLTLRLRQFDEHLEQVALQDMVLSEQTASSVAFAATGEGRLAGLSYRETAPGEMQIDVTLKEGPVVTALVTKR
ncbi:MAG: DUF6265 family protein [Pseudomonadota bacterium]